MVYTFDKANANVPSERKIQYFEMAGNRGIYNDGWYANTTPPVPPWKLQAATLPMNEYKWELYNLKVDFTYDGLGLGKSDTGVLKVDGREVRTLQIPKTIPFVLPFNETFDVGADTRTGVNDQDYEVPFRFNGTIDKLTFNLGPEQLTAADRKAAEEALARAHD